MPPSTRRIPLTDDQIKTARDKWRVPNWRDEKEYKYVAHDYHSPLINDQLRWEFVRRQQQYRDEWRNPSFCRSTFGLIEPIDPSLRGDELGSRTVLFIESVLRGGMVSMAMPTNMAKDAGLFCKEFGEAILEFENDGFLILGFNPLLPETPQLERALEIFQHHRNNLISKKEEVRYKEMPIEHPSQLLRVLDAYNEGISDLEIGEVIYALASNDTAVKAHARAVANSRIKEAKSCWARVIPSKRNVLL